MKVVYTTLGWFMLVETTGASRETAGANHYTAGEDASGKCTRTSSIKCDIHPAIICGRAGGRAIRATDPPTNPQTRLGGGTMEWAFGLVHIDITPSGGEHQNPKGEWDSEEHLEEIKEKFNWNREGNLTGGIAAYNVGVGNIHSYKEVDVKTTGGDYSNDDVARARWYHIYWYQDGNPYCQIS
uniref:Lysozyme g n=1 Tax=Oncorhynchus kisutch TaxID=8019 RepID=A0A8C7KXS2_ONCKI